MSEFCVRGRFRARDGYQEFEKTVDAENQRVALEYVYSRLGSNHGLDRRQIDLHGVTA